MLYLTILIGPFNGGSDISLHACRHDAPVGIKPKEIRGGGARNGSASVRAAVHRRAGGVFARLAGKGPGPGRVSGGGGHATPLLRCSSLARLAPFQSGRERRREESGRILGALMQL